MKENLPKVFGVKNDFFAEMLFVYISEHAPETHIINFHQFFSRLSFLWPKKGAGHELESKADQEWRLRNEREAKRARMRNFMYEFIRVNGGKYISILDLVQLCCYFKQGSCEFGNECDELMRNYKRINIEPKYVHGRTEFGFQQYNKYVPYSCLIDDLEYAFVG